MEENKIIEGNGKMSFFSHLPYWILLVVTFLVPIFFLPNSIISTQFISSLFFAFGVIFSVILYICSGFVSGSIDLPKSSKYLLGLMFVVPCVYTLSGIFGGLKRVSFFGYAFDISTVGFIVLGFCYMFLVSIFFRKKESILYSYFVFIISTIILSLFILARFIFGAEFFDFGIFNNNVPTPVGSWNNLGIFFGISVIFSFVTLQTLFLNRFVKVLICFSLAVSLFFLIVVNFTSVWMVIGVCAFVFAVYNFFKSQSINLKQISLIKKLFRFSVYPAIVFIISFVFVIWGSGLGAYLSTKLEVMSLEVRPDFSTTSDLVIKTIKSKPFFGSGPNTFVNQWLAHRPDSTITTDFWDTNFAYGVGLIPTFAVTTGLVGLLSWFLFLGHYVFIGVKTIFIKTNDYFSQYLLSSSFFISLYLWIMTFVYVPSPVIFILTFFFTGLFFASVYASGLIQVETKILYLKPKTGFICALILVAVLIACTYLGYGLWKNLKSLWYFQKSSIALNQDRDITASKNYILKAIVSVPNDTYYRALSQLEVLKIKAILSQDTKDVKPEEIKKQFSDTLANAVKAGMDAKDFDSSNYLNWVNLGQIYESVSMPELKIEGVYESAQFEYIEALNMNPKNPSLLLTLARLFASRNDLEQAETYAQKAIQIRNNYIDAYFLLSQIEVARGNLQGAVKSITSASVIDPTNPGLVFQLGLLKYNLKDWNGAIESLEKAISMVPDYANAKFFLGFSYEAINQHDKAIRQFEELKATNPESVEVDIILSNLRENKPIFTNSTNTQPEKSKNLPLKEI